MQRLHASSAKIFKAHRGGKISIRSTTPIRSRSDLSIVYTPGVAHVCTHIAAHPDDVRRFTIAGDTVAVVTDGSAVLGLGNIGPRAALPVMEGKAAIFATFAGLRAFPICLATQDVDTIVATVRAIAPSFAAVNLEDIAAPRCFAIEEQLQGLGIPVMHDDQHGTAVVVLAALLNACRATKRSLENVTVVISGAGAAGTAIAKFLAPRTKNCLLVDSQGLICDARTNLDSGKRALLTLTNKENVCGSLADALVGAEVFIGVSKPGIITPDMIRTMAPHPIILAMANPVPEIMPDIARAAGAGIVGTGRSDFPNQVNNALAYPGIFRGAIDAHAPRITEAMQLAAAHALARLVPRPDAHHIIPSLFDPKVVPAVARAVARAARM
ncbi:NADP-dependent malic enzyme [Candidatus Uhrbacteria bacterium]|nr:NADP-dependent malic enzyme [Candidatus Uhrbacteria bacterium]